MVGCANLDDVVDSSMAKQVRDNAYYERRLRDEHPGLHADVLSGKLTLSEAFFSAGLRKKRTRVAELVNAWKKATPAEQAEFLRLTGMAVAPGGPAVSPVSSSSIHIDRRLTLAGRDAITRFMADRRMSTGDLMTLIGRSRLNASVGMALHQGTTLDAALLADLEELLRSHGYFA